MKENQSNKISRIVYNKTGVSSMIRSAMPTVSPVANIVFALNLFLFWKVGTDGRTDDMCKSNDT